MSYTLDFPIQYIPNPDRFATIGLGELYIGVVDGDPAFEPADRIQVYIARQNDTDLAIPQPIELSAGGVPVYLGSPVTLKINQSFSVAVLDKNGAQVYYSPKTGEVIDLVSDLEDQIDDIQAAVDAITDDSMLTFDSVADAALSSPIVGNVYYLESYILGLGVGGGHLIAKAGAITPDNVDTFASSLPGIYLERINIAKPSPADAGVQSDGVVDDSVPLERWATLATIGRIDTATKASTTTVREVIDNIFVGDGSIDEIYRKEVIPTLHKEDDFYAADFNAAKHFRHACTVAKPVHVHFGDSIQTYAANTNSRGDLQVEALRIKLNQDFPNGITFYNRAVGGQSYNSAFSNLTGLGIPWMPPYVLGWIKDVCDQLNPDSVSIGFGMNYTTDLAGMKALIDYLESRAKKPSIVVLTNMVPRPNSSFVPVGSEKTEMEYREAAAGYTRTYAKYRGLGLIDVHRKYCKVVDGYDPASTVLRQGVPLSLVVGANRTYTAASDANECQWELYFDDSAGAAWMTGGAPGIGIVINFEGGFVQLTRSGGNLGISVYSGLLTLVSTVVPCNFTNTLQWNLTVEKKNGYLNIYQAWNPATGYGGYEEPIFCQRIAYSGGAGINSAYSPGLMNANFREGVTIKNMPSIKNSTFWNVEGADQGYGGSGYNHPSHWAGGLVYRPLFEAINFYTYIPRTGQIAVPAASGSIAVPLVPKELNANYRVFVTFADGNPVATGRVEFRQDTKFDYFFTANTTNATTLHWELVRI